MPPRDVVRILCFGDSLTSGYCQFGLDSHPYSIRLEDRLKGAFPNINFDIVTCGQPGDVAAFARFRQRLEREYQGQRFDWVIILGGTNDIGTGVPVEETFPALQYMYEFALLKSSKVLALTVPECHAKSSRLDDKRDSLNRQILAYKHPNYHTFDLKTHIPYHSLSGTERETYWDDGLHLTPDGYDWMGAHVADALTSILRRDEQLAQAKATVKTPAPAPKAGGETSLEEETGNPRHISQGYVVVRKHDLY